MTAAKDHIKMMVRVPRDVKDWLTKEAARNCASQNSEIIRSVIQRMDREREAQDAKDRAAAAVKYRTAPAAE